MDLAYLRDLLGLLKDMDVAAFSSGGITVTFRDPPEQSFPPPLAGRTETQVIADEDKSTSSKPVEGFSKRDGWRNPSLWPGQAGKVLKFDGSLE